MSGKDKFIRSYAAFGTGVRISSNSKAWLDSVSDYLALPQQQETSGVVVSLDLYDLHQDELDVDVMPPLPGEAFKGKDRILLVERSIPFSSYVKDGQRWVDYSGFGRSWIDTASGRAIAVRYTDCGVDSLYADILFGYNTIISLLWKSGFQAIHASAVAVDGKGIVFTGDSGKGKSTAAFAMLANGYPVVSDDRVLLHQKQGAYYGVSLSDVIKVREDSLNKFFPELRVAKPYRELEGEIYFKAGCSDGRMKFVPSIQINKLVILVQTGLPESRCEKVNPARVVGDLFPTTLNPEDPMHMSDKFTFLMDFLQRTECYRVYFGTDMKDFARVIFELQNR